MNQPTEFCNNCQKSLPESKFDLHLGYCRRNIRKCDECRRPYDINEVEEHQQQFHSFGECQHCGIKVLTKQLSQHINSCISKPIPCMYCELPIPTDKFQQHRIQCESRTKTCEKCTRPVMNREYFNHLDSCEGPPQIIQQPQNSQTQYSSPYSSYSNYISSFGSYSYSDQQPRQVIRTYTRTTTTDPRTGEVTTVVNEDSSQSQPRVIRRPYNPSDNIVRHQARVISNNTSNTSSNYPTNTSTYTTNYTSPASNYGSSHVQRTGDNGSQQYSEADDPELQAALMASLGYQDENVPDVYTEILRQQELEKEWKKK